MKHILLTLLFVTILQFCPPARSYIEADQSLFVVGSTTVSEVIDLLSKAYFEQTGRQLLVRPIGSDKGIISVVENVSDIGIISRFLTTDELRRWPDLLQITIGQDAVVFFVHQDNQLTSISEEQVQAFYSGQQNIWPSSAFGQRMPLMLMAKNLGHGTHDAFLNYFRLASSVAATGKPRPDGKAANSLKFRRNEISSLFSAQTVTGFDFVSQAVGTVARNPNALAFDSLGSLTSFRKAQPKYAFKVLALNEVLPIQNGQANPAYPFRRPLNLLVRQPLTAATQALVDFALSSSGQQILQQNGFIALDSPHGTEPVAEETPAAAHSH